jgi:O-antigen ligase
MRKWLEEKIDFASGILVASFFAVPALRSVVGIGQSAYFLLIGLILAIVLFKTWMGQTRRLGTHERWFVGGSLLLLGWLLMTVFWTASNEQYGRDILLVGGLLALVTSVPFVIGRNTLKTAIGTLSVVGCAVGGYVIYGYATIDSLGGYNVIFGEFYLTVAQSIGAATVGLTIHTLFAQRRRWWQWGAVLFLFLTLALSLARGALLFTVLIVVISVFYALFRPSLGRSSIGAYLKSILGRAAGTGAVVGVGALIFTVALTVEKTARRLILLLSGGGSSVAVRLQLWRASSENIAEAPILGYGLGSNGIMAGATEAAYPHNFLLQVWLDGGIVALLLAAFVVALPLWAFLRSDQTAGALELSLLGVYVFMVLEYSKSYNFYTSRLLFIFGILALSSFRKLEC